MITHAPTPGASLFAERCRAFFALDKAEDAINDVMLRALGANPEDVESWPYDDIGFDWYDNSVELYEFTRDRRLSAEEVAGICATGLHRIFVNYAGGGERSYRIGFESEFRERPTRARNDETVRKVARLAAQLARIRQRAEKHRTLDVVQCGRGFAAALAARDEELDEPPIGILGVPMSYFPPAFRPIAKMLAYGARPSDDADDDEAIESTARARVAVAAAFAAWLEAMR